MSEKDLTLKEQLGDLVGKIAKRIDENCTNYEKDTYLKWIDCIEENRKCDMMNDINSRLFHCTSKMVMYPNYCNEFNPYYRVHQLCLDILNRIQCDKEGSTE